jgi:hypothetical protein
MSGNKAERKKKWKRERDLVVRKGLRKPLRERKDEIRNFVARGNFALSGWSVGHVVQRLCEKLSRVYRY